MKSEYVAVIIGILTFLAVILSWQFVFKPRSAPQPEPQPGPQPQDSDGDGVIDARDECPNTAGEAKNGCPVEVDAMMASVDMPDQGMEGQEKKSCITFMNTGNVEKRFMVEQGIIPDSVASDWGLSILSIYKYGQCCPGMEIIQDKWVTLAPKEKKKVCIQLKVPDSHTEDLCGDTDYWKGATDLGGESYTIYGMVSNHCRYRSGQKVSEYKQFAKSSHDFKVCSGLSCNWGPA